MSWWVAGGIAGGYLLGSKSGGGGGGGSSSSPSSESITTSNIAPWAQPGVQSLIQSGLYNVYPNYNPNTGYLGPQSGYTPFNANSTDPMTQQALNAAKSSVAGFTPLQQQSFNAAQNMQTPGQYNAATGITNQAARGALGTTGTAGLYGNLGAQAGLSYGQNATNPNAVAAYMNPYLQNTLQPSLQLLNQQYGMQQAANQGAATQAGAFGGSRGTLQNALNQQNQLLATNQLVGNAYNQAYNTANQNMQAAAGLGIQGAQAGLQGVGAQQTGYGLAGTQGQNLANIGTQQLAAQQGIAGLQNAYGAQQQQQAQNVLNQGMANYSTMQQYPMQQLAQLESLYAGAPQNVTTQNYTAAPSLVSQVAGLGLAGYGLNKSGILNNKGGRIKAPDNRGGLDKLKTPGFEKFAEGGIVGFLAGGSTPADYRQMIINQAKAKGLDPNVALALSGAEGTIKNPKSTATGYFQMIDKTFKDYGGDPEKRNDPAEQIRVGTDILADNTKRLTKSLGRAPTPSELYTTHFLGEPTGTALLRTDPNMPVSEFLQNVSPKKKDQIIKANPEILGETGDKTVGQVRETLASKINRYLPMGSAQAGTLTQAQPQAGTIPQTQIPVQPPQQGGLAALIPGQDVKAPAVQPEDNSFMGANWFMNKGAKLGAMMGDEAAGREAGRAAFNTMMAPTPMAPVSTIPKSGGVVSGLSKLGETIYNKLVPAQGFTKEGIEALQAENQAAKAAAEAANLMPRRLTLSPPPLPAGGPAISVTQAGQDVVAAQDALTQTRLANQAADQAAAAQKIRQLAAAAQSVPSAAEAVQNASLLREGSEAANIMSAARAATTAKQLGATTAATAAGLGGLPSLVSGQQPEDYSAQENFRRSEITQENATPQNQPAPVRDLSTIDTGTTQETPAGKDKYGADFLMQLGLGMMAGKSQYALQNVGEAGLGALKSTQEQKRADTAEELKRLELAMNEKRYGAEAGKYAAETAYLNNLRGPQAAVASADKNFAEWLKLPENIGKSQAEKDAAQRLFLNRAYQGLGIIQPGSLSADDLALIQKHAGS